MSKTKRVVNKVSVALLGIALCLSACNGGETPAPIIITATASTNLPVITSNELDRTELPRYESLEMTVTLNAEYTNPFDAREVTLDGVFTSPNGASMRVPGFWDGKEAWHLRFTPSEAGAWTYALTVTDKNGVSLPYQGQFTVTPSDLHGWLMPGDRFDPSYSSRYLVHHDGTPFYGVGHCEPLNILVDGFDVEDGVRLFDNMQTADENYVVWWPLFSYSFITETYDKYSASKMATIDLVVEDAQKEGIFLVFTIWDHPNLRDETHAWNDGRWSLNGFSKLGDINSFFQADEAWAWQENFYRYIIARWGYSPAIGMWLTVSEINGTNAYSQTDFWHERVHNYFAANDPYRHPTSASGSGEEDWERGHLVMDVPQVHLYDWSKDDVVGAAADSARWTSLMWERTARPNWIGEYGIADNGVYPELMHYVNWAALASGASMTPAEWNDAGQWSRMTPEMNADIARLAFFVKDLPLAQWDPSTLKIDSAMQDIRAWGIAGDGGIIWVQDVALAGQPLDVVRTAQVLRSGVQIEIRGLVPESYEVTPYDTWQGKFLPASDMLCEADVCTLTLPDFISDIAIRLIRK